jgi:dihydrofolate reductase
MRRLIESTIVTLGGDISAPQDWAPPYLSGSEQDAYARELLFGADALLLGRRTYEGLYAAYPAMASPEGGPMADFIERMNAIPKYVASTTLTSVGWNSTLLTGDAAERVAELKEQPGTYLLKYGTGPLDRILVANGLVDEFRIWMIPVTNPPGQRLFEDLPDISMTLIGVRSFPGGVVLLTYSPDSAASRLDAGGSDTPGQGVAGVR